MLDLHRHAIARPSDRGCDTRANEHRLTEASATRSTLDGRAREEAVDSRRNTRRRYGTRKNSKEEGRKLRDRYLNQWVFFKDSDVGVDSCE